MVIHLKIYFINTFSENYSSLDSGSLHLTHLFVIIGACLVNKDDDGDFSAALYSANKLLQHKKAEQLPYVFSYEDFYVLTSRTMINTHIQREGETDRQTDRQTSLYVYC